MNDVIIDRLFFVIVALVVLVNGGAGSRADFGIQLYLVALTLFVKLAV